MPYQIGEVAKLSGVSVRTLHHYDAISLLTPSMRTDAGYRLYIDSDIQRLRQILFFKALDFNLEAIASILDDPAFDFHTALIEQRKRIRRQSERVEKVLTLIDNLLAEHQEASPMTTTTSSLFNVFNDFDPALYEEEVQQRWGDTDAYRESTRRAKHYSEADWQKIKAEGNEIISRLAELLAQGFSPQDEQSVGAVESYRLHIGRWFYPCSREMHAQLGKMYVSDNRFTTNFDKVRSGLAQFICDATAANAKT